MSASTNHEKKKPIAKVVIRNVSPTKPLWLKRVKSNMEYPINPLSAVGVDMFKTNADSFIGVDPETGRVLIDFGEE